MYVIRPGKGLARERKSEKRSASAREEEGAKGREFAKNRGSFGYRQKSLVMVVEENEQEEDEDGDVQEAREREQERGERRGAV